MARKPEALNDRGRSAADADEDDRGGGGLDTEPGIGEDPHATDINAAQQDKVPEEEVRRPVRRKR